MKRSGQIARASIQDWVVEALKDLGGSGTVLDIAKKIWELHRKELEESGDLFFTWQYDFRWAGTELRRKKIIAPPDRPSKNRWVLI